MLAQFAGDGFNPGAVQTVPDDVAITWRIELGWAPNPATMRVHVAERDGEEVVS